MQLPRLEGQQQQQQQVVVVVVEGQGGSTTRVVHGLCALMWVMHVKGAPLSLEMRERKIGADGLAALARGMAPSLAALLLDGSDCANNGGDLSGLKVLCSAMENGFTDGLKELRCALPDRFQTVMKAHVAKRFAMPYSPALFAVQPRGKQPWCRGLQGGRGCARQDPDHVTEVRQPPCPAPDLCVDFVPRIHAC